MKDVTIKYKRNFLTVFTYYLDDKISDEFLVEELRRIESFARRKLNLKEENQVWFKLFKDDTQATTIKNIESDLKTKNKEYLIDCFKLAVENKYLMVYFS